jgi:hypothetical protein
MRAFSAAWRDRAIVQGLLAQITWYHNIALLEKAAAQRAGPSRSQFQSYQALSDRRNDLTTVAKRSGWS